MRLSRRLWALPLVGAAMASLVVAGQRPASRTELSPEPARVVHREGQNRGPMSDAARIPVAGSPSLGPADALVTVVVFSDFQCPFCSRVEPTLRQLREQYGNDLRVVWKDHPLPFHTNARPAAEAAREAFAQRGDAGFWQMHDLLFDNQHELTRATLDGLARQMGLDEGRFAAALDQHTHEAAIARDEALARTLGANGTPTFFINGTELVGAQPMERFDGVVRQVLARARTITPRSQAYALMVTSPVANPDPPRPSPSPSREEPDPTQVLRVPVGTGASRGPASALVTVVVFSDFQCPFCSRVESTLADLRRRYGNDLRVVWRNEPLPFHDHAQLAAEAALEAKAQLGPTGFWQMHDLLFENQQHLERADLERYAERMQLNLPRFRAALDRHTHLATIRADHALAQQLEANGTPHFFINGRRLVGAQPVETFVRLVDEARTNAQNFMRTHPGTTRANLYARMMGEAATVIRRRAAAPAAAAPAPQEDENHVYVLAAAPNAPSWGPANARVVVEHFSDFQCPFCSRVGPTLQRLRETYGSRIRFVWRDYPLPFHDHAMLAAEAAREAYAQRGNEGFWRFNTLLFENQQHLDRVDLERYAADVQLDLARFRSALDQHTHQRGIRADMAAADATGASIGTPAFFINGRFFAGALPFEEFQRRIDAALAAR